MRDPGTPVPPRRRGRDDSSRLETRYIPKENKEEAQIYRNDSKCVHGWNIHREMLINSIFSLPRVVKLNSRSCVSQRWCALQGLRAANFCALRPHQKKCVFRSGLHTRAETVGPKRNTPTWWLSAGLPKQFYVTDVLQSVHARGQSERGK